MGEPTEYRYSDFWSLATAKNEIPFLTSKNDQYIVFADLRYNGGIYLAVFNKRYKDQNSIGIMDIYCDGYCVFTSILYDVQLCGEQSSSVYD